MIDFYWQLKNEIKQLTGQADFVLEVPPQADFGDLSTNVALLVDKQSAKDSKIVAQELANKLQDLPWLKDNNVQVKVAGQGFINFFLSQSELIKIINQAVGIKKFGQTDIGKNKTVVIEYSSPNTNKPLHLGHLRNDAIGMSLAKIYKFLGYQVIKTEVINDRGIHIMKSLLAYQKWGENQSPKKIGVKGDKFVGDLYVKYNQAVKNNPELIEEARQLLKAWEKKDKKIISLWKKMNAWVYQGWRVTYKIYGSEFDQVYYESQLYDKGREIIIQAEKKGLVKRNSEGSVVVDLSSYGLGGRDSGEKILLRSDGTTVYITQDIYLVTKRLADYDFAKMIYVVGDEQIYHFKVLFKILEILGFTWQTKCQHYPYGQVLLPEGKMKSREGTVVDADDLITELTKQAWLEVKQRQLNLTKKKQQELAQTIALAAIKYWFLKTSPKSTITFDPQASLSLEGNTGPYLLYTLVRLKRILQKAKLSKIKNIKYSDKEILLVRKICQWPLAVHQYYERQQANYLAEYLYQLAGIANTFYQNVPVLNAEEKIRKQRLQLIQATVNVISRGLDLLNIKSVDKM
jgi:arginyl-tRNA synthetase